MDIIYDYNNGCYLVYTGQFGRGIYLFDEYEMNEDGTSTFLGERRLVKAEVRKLSGGDALMKRLA